MDWEAIGAIGEVLGAIGVIVTLGYLAIQIRANTSAVRSESRGRIANFTQGYSAVIGGSREVASVFFRGLSDLNSLDPEEQTQFVFLFSMLVNQAHDEHHEYALGLANVEEWQAHSSAAIRLLQSPGGREYWRRHQADYPERFQEFINSRLRGGSIQ